MPNPRHVEADHLIHGQLAVGELQIMIVDGLWHEVTKRIVHVDGYDVFAHNGYFS
ncbi:hypothetical protein D3C76_1713400 [compost metagenome]